MDRKNKFRYYRVYVSGTRMSLHMNVYFRRQFKKGSIGIIVIYVVALGLMMYFLAIKPQKKQQKAQQQLMDSIEIGDYVLTTSGFYGVIMDITDDDVIVEFGNNKNCRISMQKKAIAQVEKAKSSEE